MAQAFFAHADRLPADGTANDTAGSQCRMNHVLERLTVPERDAMLECGGRVEIVGDPKDHSASEIIRSRLGPRRS